MYITATLLNGCVSHYSHLRHNKQNNKQVSNMIICWGEGRGELALDRISGRDSGTCIGHSNTLYVIFVVVCGISHSRNLIDPTCGSVELLY